MRIRIRSVLVTILFSSAVCSSTLPNHVRHFTGHKVYRVIPTTVENLIALQSMEADNDLDFWTGPRLHYHVDIMIPVHKQNEILNIFQNHQMKYTVMIEDVESLVQAERYQIRNWRRQRRDNPVKIDWESYYSYNDIITWADSLNCRNGVKLTSEVYGHSTHGRMLKVYKFSSGSSPPRRSMWVDGTFHAREWISTATVTYFMNDLCHNSSNTFLNDLDVYVAPIVNPDGYEYSRDVDRMWRKTRQDHNSSVGCVGVDPNRNFDFHFAMVGSSKNKCSETYHGPYAWSEAETSSLKDYLLNNKNAVWKAYITVHSYGQQILIPYSFDNVTIPKDYPEMEKLASKTRDVIESVHGISFTFGRSAIVYGLSTGCADDWAYAKAGFKYSYTFELRDTGTYGFLLPPDCIIPAAQETLEGLKYIANYIVNPIR